MCVENSFDAWFFRSAQLNSVACLIIACPTSDDPWMFPITALKNKKNRELENMQTNQTAPSLILH